MKYTLLILIIVTIFSSGCYDDPRDEIRIVRGYAPIYFNVDIGDNISAPPRPYDELVNFVLYKDLILMVENAEGVHVINNANPNAPEDLGFLNMPGTIGLVVKEDQAIIATTNQLISVNISNINTAIVNSITMVEGDNGISLLPPDDLRDFECVDITKGILAGWEQKELTNPKCWH